MDMAGRVQTGISGRPIQERVLRWQFLKVIRGHTGSRKKVETRTGVNSNVGPMRTNAHDPDGEEVIDTGLDDMMIDSNINIGKVFKWTSADGFLSKEPW